MRSTLRVFLTLVIALGIVVPLTYFTVSDLSPANHSITSYIPANSQVVIFSDLNDTPTYLYRTPGNASNNTGLVMGVGLSSLYDIGLVSSNNTTTSGNLTNTGTQGRLGNLLNITFDLRYDGYAIYRLNVNISALNNTSYVNGFGIGNSGLFDGSNSSARNISLANNSLNYFLLSNLSSLLKFGLLQLSSNATLFVSQDTSGIITVGSLSSVKASVSAYVDHKSFTSVASTYMDPGANISVFYNVSNDHFSLLSINIFDNSSKVTMLTHNKTFENSLLKVLSTFSNLTENVTYGDNRLSATLQVGLMNYHSVLPYLLSVLSLNSTGSK